MTAEEEIQIIKFYTGNTYKPEKIQEAIDMSIEALEKQIPKECVIDSCPDHTHYKCPSCGQIQMSTYAHGFPRLGRITKHCENCGQALQMESDSTDQ